MHSPIFFHKAYKKLLNLQVPTHNKPVVIKRIPGIVRDFAVMLQYGISCIHQFSWIIQLFRNRRNGEIIPQNINLPVLVFFNFSLKSFIFKTSFFYVWFWGEKIFLFSLLVFFLFLLKNLKIMKELHKTPKTLVLLSNTPEFRCYKKNSQTTLVQS